MKQFIGIAVMVLFLSGAVWAKDLPPNTAKVADGVYSYGIPAHGYFSMFVVTKEGVIATDRRISLTLQTINFPEREKRG